jgi:hypothetical protein
MSKHVNLHISFRFFLAACAEGLYFGAAWNARSHPSGAASILYKYKIIGD